MRNGFIYFDIKLMHVIFAVTVVSLIGWSIVESILYLFSHIKFI